MTKAEQAARMRAEGKTVAEIMAHFGWTRSSADNMLPIAPDPIGHVLVRDEKGDILWRSLCDIKPSDTVVEIETGFGLSGNGLKFPLEAFRR